MSAVRKSGVVAISCNMSEIDGHHSHRAGHRYVTAVHEVAGALPLLVPALGDVLDAEHLLDSVDGVLLTGGASNVEPHHYAGDPGVECGPHDPGRDGIAFNLVRGAVRRGIPLFGICRGHQEINVAFGGSLHPRLHEVPGRFDHRRPRDKPMEVQLSPRQNITLTPGGYLQDLLGGDETIMVNTLHGQGIDLLGQGLVVEAVADDSTVEAIRVADAKGFAVGVQWHPEYQAAEHRLYAALFQAFGAAVRDYASRRRGSAQAAE